MAELLAVVRAQLQRGCQGRLKALQAIQRGRGLEAHHTQQAVEEGRNQEAEVVANLGAAEHAPHDPFLTTFLGGGRQGGQTLLASGWTEAA
eukprot:2297557-Amphidinium_carterae.1